jgi:phospholipid transport system substrate-binding protein
MLNRLLFIFIALFMGCQSLSAATPPTSPQYAFQLVKSTVGDAVGIIDNAKIPAADKRAKLSALVTPFFDFKTITMLTVGKEYWSKLTTAEVQSLSAAYQTYLMKFYLDKVVQFSTGKITYGNPTSVSATKVHIPVTMFGDGQDYKMLYKLYYKDGWKAYDFELEGVSIIQTYHTQFEPFLKKGDIAGLIRVLK